MALVFTPVYSSANPISDVATGWQNGNVNEATPYDRGIEIYTTGRAAAMSRNVTPIFFPDYSGNMVRNTGTFAPEQYGELYIGALSGSGGTYPEQWVLLNCSYSSGNSTGYMLMTGSDTTDAKYAILRRDAGSQTVLAASGNGSTFTGTKIIGYREPVTNDLVMLSDQGGSLVEVLRTNDTTYMTGRPGAGSYGAGTQATNYFTRLILGDVTVGTSTAHIPAYLQMLRSNQ